MKSVTNKKPDNTAQVGEKLKQLTNSIRNKRYNVQQVPYNLNFCLDVIRAIGKGYCPRFTIDETNQEAFIQMVKYFMGDPGFEGDLTKGLMLRGKKGTGKTLAIIIFKEYLRYFKLQIRKFDQLKPIGFELVRTKEITSLYEQIGIEVLHRYKQDRIICFDDLGEEDKRSKFYTNELNVMEDVLTMRYFLFLKDGLQTHCTTNYVFEHNGTRYFQDFYGSRVEDRMKEMFNQIIFKGESRR